MCRRLLNQFVVVLLTVLPAVAIGQNRSLTQLPTGGELRVNVKSVSVSGSVAAVAGDDGRLHGARGVAAIYERRDDEWLETFFLQIPCPGPDGLTGCPLQIAVDGARVAVAGSPDDEVLILEKSESGWESVYSISVPTFAGVSLDLQADRLLVTRREGDVLLYELGGADAALVDQFQISDSRVSGAINVGDILVGAFNEGTGGTALAINALDGSSTELQADDTRVGDAFGASVSLDGDLALVGAPGRDIDEGAGTAYLFQRSGHQWDLIEEFRNSKAMLGFGSTVSLNDGRAIVGGSEGESLLFHSAEGMWSEEVAFSLGSIDRVDVATDGLQVVFGGGAEAWVYTVPEPSSLPLAIFGIIIVVGAHSRKVCAAGKLVAASGLTVKNRERRVERRCRRCC